VEMVPLVRTRPWSGGLRRAMEEKQTDLSLDGRQVSFALGSADGAVVMDLLR
jgi:hypothetical protein